MRNRTAEPEMFVDQMSTATADGGIVRVGVPCGGIIVQLAMTPYAANALFEILRRAVLSHHADQGAGVVPFPRKAKGKRHA